MVNVLLINFYTPTTHTCKKFYNNFIFCNDETTQRIAQSDGKITLDNFF